MTDAVDVVVEDEAAKAAQLAADAEFESGYGNEPTEETLPVDEPAAPATEEAPKQEEVKYRQITEAEYESLQALSTEIKAIKADHRKELDKAFGKVGGVERTLAALQAATPQGYSVEVTDDVVEDLQKEFPELGGLTLKAFKSFAGKLKGTAPTSQAIDPNVVAGMVTNNVVALQMEALDEDVPNWREIVGPVDAKNPYREWLAKQPAEYQTKLGSTNSAAVIAKSITKFEADSKVQSAEAQAAAKKAAEAKAAEEQAAARKQRLEKAVTPKGSGGHTPSDATDDFEAGYQYQSK